MLNDDVRAAMADAVLCWCATADERGRPNVSPKELFAPSGEDGMVIADIASPATVRNLQVNPQICVSMVEIFRQAGVKLSGTAQVIGRDETGFSELARPLLKMAGGRFPIRHVIHMRIDRTARIVAPSYHLFPEMTVDQRMEEAMRTYGVRPA